MYENDECQMDDLYLEHSLGMDVLYTELLESDEM